MIPDLKKAKIYVRPGYTDLRKAVNGLSTIIQDGMKGDPLSGNVFLFCNRSRHLLKAVWWDRTGFWLAQKRLETERWPWPENETAAQELTDRQTEMLLDGIDFWKAHKELHYTSID